MKFTCPLIAVSNIEDSKKFYQDILNQKIVLDFGANVTFKGNFALQANFSELVGFDKSKMIQGSNNFELYFEEDDIDAFVKHLKKHTEIKYVHGIKEHEWGQRVIRFYDPDMHMIEVGESMERVIRRFLEQGLSVEDTAKRTMFPIQFVKNCLQHKD